MGKWLAVLAAFGTVVFTASLTRKNNMNWNKMMKRTMKMMSNGNMRRIVKRGRKMIARWT